MTSRWRLAAVVLLGAPMAPAAVGACAPVRGKAFETAFAQGARAEGAGRFAEAASAYDEATTAAIRTRDREQARWDAAVIVAKTGPLTDALARLDAIAAGGGEHAAEAAFRAADLRIAQGDVAAGWTAMEQVAVRYPKHGVAHVAIRRVVEHARETGGGKGALDELHALALVVGSSTEVTALVAYLTARELQAQGDDAGALAAFLQIADGWPYPFGAFFDDALWYASFIDEKQGRPKAAVDDLERMVKERETTTIVGTYERPRYVPAMLRIGALWQGPLHDASRARAAYHRLYADFANSTSRDDALWLEASSWRADGDPASACGLLARLVHDFPDSRYVPCALGQCSGLTRPAKSDAPKDCHPYIERALDRHGEAGSDLGGKASQPPSGSSSSSSSSPSSSSSSRSSSSSSSNSSSSS